MVKDVRVVELPSVEVIDFRIGLTGYREYKIRHLSKDKWGEEQWVSWSGHQPVGAEGEPATVGSMLYTSQVAVLMLQEFDVPTEETEGEPEEETTEPKEE